MYGVVSHSKRENFNLNCFMYNLSFFTPIISNYRMFQFIVIASTISFTKPEYNDKELPVGGEVLGWMMTAAPLVIIVGVGIYEVLKRGPLTRENFVKVVSNVNILNC